MLVNFLELQYLYTIIEIDRENPNYKNYNLNNVQIKGNAPFPIFLIEAIISAIEKITMVRHLMNKKNM
jgi:hypothetical protein